MGTHAADSGLRVGLSSPRVKRRESVPSILRRFTLPAMLGILALYMVLHSPLRSGIASLAGMDARGCYFGCTESPAQVTASSTIVSDVPLTDTTAIGKADISSTPSSVDGTLDSLSAWLLIALAVAAGWVVASSLSRNGLRAGSISITGEGDPAGAWAPYEGTLVFALSALSFIAVPAAALGGLGALTNMPLLRPPSGPLLAGVPAIGTIALAVWRGWRPAWSVPVPTTRFRGSSLFIVWGAAAGLLLLSLIVALSHPPTGYDALSYHVPLAVFLWQDGNISTFLDRAPDLWALAQPGTVELWFGLLQIAGGESLANLGQLPFALLAAAAVGVFTRRLGLGPGSARLAGGACLLAPMVVMQVGRELNDVAAGAVLMSVFALACAPVATWHYKRLGLIGLGFGLVAASKLALLPCVFAIGLFVIVEVSRWGRHFRSADIPWRLAQPTNRGSKPGAGSVIRLLGVMVAMCLIVVAPWWIRNMVRYGNPVYPSALPFVGHGVVVSDFGKVAQLDADFVPSPLAWPLYPLLEQPDDGSGFGTLFVLGLVPGLLVAGLRAHRPPFVLFVMVVVVLLPAWWIILPHHPRFLLSVSSLAMAFLPWSLLAVPRAWRSWAVAAVAIAAVFSGATTIDQALLPEAREPTTRPEFYERVWGVDPAVLGLPENAGVLYNTGYAKYTYPAYYPLLGPTNSRKVISVDVDASQEVIIAQMKSAGLEYAYVVASPQSRAVVERIYDTRLFTLVHASVVEQGELAGTRRYLYLLK